jgi:hypothetical protein
MQAALKMIGFAWSKTFSQANTGSDFYILSASCGNHQISIHEIRKDLLS